MLSLKILYVYYFLCPNVCFQRDFFNNSSRLNELTVYVMWLSVLRNAVTFGTKMETTAIKNGSRTADGIAQLLNQNSLKCCITTGKT